MAKIHYKGEMWIKHFLFRKINKTMMKEFAKYSLKMYSRELQKTIDEKTFISILQYEVKFIGHFISTTSF